MQSGIPENLAKIARAVDAGIAVPEKSLKVLEKWFARPSRLCSFALFIAKQGSSPENTTCEITVERLLARARVLLDEYPAYAPRPPLAQAEALYRDLRAFQSEYARYGAP